MKKILLFIAVILPVFVFSQRVTGNNSLMAKSEITSSLVGLGNVENTALSTWAGSANLTTLGIIGTGTWQGGVISSTYGGTGVNNGGRTLTLNTNSGTIAFSAASKTVTFGNSITYNGTDATTMTFPSTSQDIVGRTETQTLTNKTLTSPKIANTDFLADGNGNELIIFTTTASAVNELTFANGATGVNPKWTASGETNVGIDWLVKGTGVYRFLATTSNPTDMRLFEDADNGTNYVSIVPASALGGDVVLTLPSVTSTIGSSKSSSEASNATPAPTGDAVRNYYTLTALAAGATFGVPSGTLTHGNILVIQIKDNGTARSLAWNSGTDGYMDGDIALPTTTVINQWMVLTFIYNSTAQKWLLVGVVDNIS